jgi:hypothetical protein
LEIQVHGRSRRLYVLAAYPLHLHGPQRLITVFCGAWGKFGERLRETANAATPRPAVDLSVRAVEVLLSERAREYRRSTNRRSSLSFSLCRRRYSPFFRCESCAAVQYKTTRRPGSLRSRSSLAIYTIPLLSPASPCLYPSFSCYYRLGTRHQDSSECGGSGILGSHSVILICGGDDSRALNRELYTSGPPRPQRSSLYRLLFLSYSHLDL